MRTKTVAVLAGLVALVGFAGSASAASISLVWASNGTNTITAGAGIQLLDVIIDADAAGISQLSLSLSATGGTTFVGMTNDGTNEECISPPNLATGLCFAGGGSVSPFTPGVGPPGLTPTTVRTIEAGTGGTGPASASFLLAQAIVNVGAGGVNVFFDPIIDGVFDNTSANITSSTNIFNAVVTPEPGTAALLGLGLGALAIAGRRR